jgi:hypothetical protein
VIIPGFADLRIKINTKVEATRKGVPYIVMPWMFAPWPEAKEKGVVEILIEGETLRDLLVGLSDQYKRAHVDFEPINPKTDDVDFILLTNRISLLHKNILFFSKAYLLFHCQGRVNHGRKAYSERIMPVYSRNLG